MAGMQLNLLHFDIFFPKLLFCSRFSDLNFTQPVTISKVLCFYVIELLSGLSLQKHSGTLLTSSLFCLFSYTG